MNRSQAKFHNTAVKMDNAFLELLHEKEFAEITVLEICKRAGVNRSTFYLHYENTYDLLNEAQNYIMESFWKSFEHKTMPKDLSGVPNADLNFISPEYLVPYLEFIKQNRFMFRVYMENMQVFNSNAIGDFFLNEVFVPVLSKHGINDKTVASYMLNYYLTGITAVVMKWVKRDCIDDIMFLCEIINACVRPLA